MSYEIHAEGKVAELRAELARLRQENEALRASAARTEAALREFQGRVQGACLNFDAPSARGTMESVREAMRELGLWRPSDAAREEA